MMKIDHENRWRGILLMIAAMAAFATADTLIKLLAETTSPEQVMFFLLGGGLIVFSSLAVTKRDRFLDWRAFKPALMVRYVAEASAMVGMLIALARVPLSTVGAILQAVPLVILLGAVLFLSEKVTWRQWGAVGVGFLGVVLIIQPGSAGFDANALWAVLAMVGLAIRDLATRATPPDMASSSLSIYTMIAAVPVAMVWIGFTGVGFIPDGVNWLLIVCMIGCGSSGYLLLTESVRTTAVSIVAPFRYFRLIFMVGLGMLIFGERPDHWMIAGSVLIVGSGLVAMLWSKKTA